MRVEHGQDRVALGFIQPLNMGGEDGVHEQCLLARDRVGADDGL